MHWNASTLDSLRRLFAEGFTVRDIAEPMLSFDASTDADDALRLMNQRNFDVVGIRREGAVIGYVERGDLIGETCGQHVREFEAALVVSDAASLADTVLKLETSPRLFVRILGSLGGIVTKSDLQKPPVRMWLFGIITIVEMRLSALIEKMCPGDAWREFLSESRLQKAQVLLEERLRRNQSLGLVDCLQFSDKGQIIARNEAIRELTMFDSRRKTETAIRMLESLRNNLAHSQDILACDWETILLLSRGLDAVLTGTEQVQAALEGKRPCSPQS